jgi:hypothetical protein
VRRLLSLAIWRTTTLAAAGLLAAGVVVASGGGVDTVSADPNIVGGSGAPAWAEPCQEREPRYDRELLRSCVRVAGRVLAVKHATTPSGETETHLMTIADFHVFVVKLSPHHPRPSLGSSITAIGPLVRARNGLREVDAIQVNSP